MTNKEILDNAPKGANYIDSELKYFLINSDNEFPLIWYSSVNKWFPTDNIPTAFAMLRSLADIKRIVELELSEKVLFKMLREFWSNDFYPIEAVYDELLDKANQLKEQGDV